MGISRTLDRIVIDIYFSNLWCVILTGYLCFVG